jgi:hypothetical protein
MPFGTCGNGKFRPFRGCLPPETGLHHIGSHLRNTQLISLLSGRKPENQPFVYHNWGSVDFQLLVVGQAGSSGVGEGNTKGRPKFLA